MLLNQPKTNHIYWINKYEADSALNNLQWLICKKNPKQTISNIFNIYVLRGFGIK